MLFAWLVMLCGRPDKKNCETEVTKTERTVKCERHRVGGLKVLINFFHESTYMDGICMQSPQIF